jgi:DtxR family Mn-dependent transcriptional regulator
MVHHEFLDQAADEVLEQIWIRREEGDDSAEAVADREDPAAAEALETLVREGLVRRDNGRLTLSPSAEARARSLVRCHRLTERLMADVLDQPLEEAEHAACLFEHVLSPAVTDAVCAFLGHPPACPHGLPIPQGPCCRNRKVGVPALVVPLGDLPPGRRGRIVFITPRFQKRLTKLESYGVIPGTVLELRQKHPSFVVEIDGTTLALEADVAGEIYVRRDD